MKYYIVALFDKEAYELILPIQKGAAKKFRTSRTSPMPFIPLICIDNPNFDKLTPILTKILSPYKTFKIDANDYVYPCEQTKSINLKLDNKGYIMTIARNLYDTLLLNGFTVKQFEEISISLGNVPYVSKEAKKQSSKTNYHELYNTDDFLKLTVSAVQVWKLPILKKNMHLFEHNFKTI